MNAKRKMPLLKTRGCSGVEPVGSRMKRRKTTIMTDFELDVDDAIVKWYSQYQGNYFDNKPWSHLYDDEKKIACEMFWQGKLSQWQ